MLAALAGTLWGQRLTDADNPPPPNGFSDKDGVLSNNPSTQKAIIGLIRDLETRHGYRFYVILERTLIASSANELASQLQQERLPEGGGLVFVFESDSRRLGLGRGLDANEGVSRNEAAIPAYVQVEIVTKALDANKDLENTELFVESLVTEIGANVDDYFKRKKAPAQGGRSLRLALVTIGALSLLALCGMGLGWLMGKADNRQSQKRAFPPVEIQERLSSPYGGGGYGSFGGGNDN